MTGEIFARVSGVDWNEGEQMISKDGNIYSENREKHLMKAEEN